MPDVILPLLEDLMSSPWVYLALFAVAAVDGFFPLVPSEASVITAGVFAASGGPQIALVVLVAALGAFAGDQASYGLGRLSGPRLHRRGRRRTALDAARRALETRGGVIIVVARYFPGARTAITLTAGAVAMRWSRFAGFAAVAGVTWGAYSALVGYVGGVAFERDPLKGLALGLGLAAAITVAAELARHRRRRAAGGELPACASPV